MQNITSIDCDRVRWSRSFCVTCHEVIGEEWSSPIWGFQIPHNTNKIPTRGSISALSHLPIKAGVLLGFFVVIPFQQIGSYRHYFVLWITAWVARSLADVWAFEQQGLRPPSQTDRMLTPCRGHWQRQQFQNTCNVANKRCWRGRKKETVWLDHDLSSFTLILLKRSHK